MKRKFFGDSYDILKKCFISWLNEFGPWSTHPMFTESISQVDADSFASFLGTDLLTTEPLTPQTDSEEYFSIGSHIGNLFLDPDTGVRLKRKVGAKSVNYIFATELVEWSHVRPESLTMVFDQCYARGQQDGGIQEKLQFLNSHEVCAFVYSSHAPFLFLSANPDLINLAKARLLKVSGLPASRFVSVGLS